jgi:class 3 adenylate cyclase
MARPPEQRPVHDTIDNIADWLLGSPRQLSDGIASFDEFAWRLLAAEMPLLRVTLHTATLHPQFLGTTITWWRDTGETVQVMIAHEVAAVARLADHPVMDGEPPLDIVIALHVGTVHYGNIGAADRLDFTVIGPAVNLVSRIENAAKMLGQPIVVSAELAAALDGVVSLGRHQLRGLTAPQELFAPD